jgi:signal transduction histidine kinase
MITRLLFVDDDPEFQELIQQLFLSEGDSQEYELFFARSGQAALEQLRSSDMIDIVLTDLRMPGLSGFELLKQVQKLRVHTNPVLTTIIISAYSDLENIRRAMNSGAFDFLTKPLDFADVRATIAKARDHVQRMKRILVQEQQAKQALQKLNQDLEQRVSKRTAQLQQSNAELNAFAHTVAHDLKNPLNIINGFVEYAIRYFGDLDSDELFDSLENVRQHATKAISIIEELMVLSGVNKREVPRFPLDMGAVLDNVQNRLTLLIAKHQPTIVVPDSWPLAIGYGPWVEEVWLNYLSNGIKYGGQPPYLTLGAESTQNGMVKFWVKDNGQGLSAEDQARLFNEFIRLDQITVEGSGLGLSIVRRIVEKLDGHVGVSSEPGAGSQFYFILPAADQ